jgi:hypothetical protein
VQATSVQCGAALIEHDLSPLKLVATPRSGSFGIGSTHGEVDRYDEFAIANDDNHEHAINAGDDTFVLAAVPCADAKSFSKLKWLRRHNQFQ